MNCKLTKEDCAEIYHALGCAHAASLQQRIGYDGEELAKGELALRRADAQIIYRALVENRGRILEGAYDSYPGEVNKPGSVSFKMRERVELILDEIGELGEFLLAKKPEQSKSA